MTRDSARLMTVAMGVGDVLLLVLLLQMLPSARGASTAPLAPTTATLETLSLKRETPHIRVMADRAPAARLREIANALEAEYPRIAADLGGTDLRVTTVVVWSDAESFYRSMEATIGRRVEGATGYVSGPAHLTVLDGTRASSRAVHELVHCVTLRVNRTIGNNPRWLWETVATYESGELIDPRFVPYLVSGTYPTLAQLNGDPASARHVYQVGFVLGEFIAARFGSDAIVRLVRANGDIERVLGIGVGEFEQRWHAFLREKYLPLTTRDKPTVRQTRASYQQAGRGGARLLRTPAY